MQNKRVGSRGIFGVRQARKGAHTEVCNPFRNAAAGKKTRWRVYFASSPKDNASNKRSFILLTRSPLKIAE